MSRSVALAMEYARINIARRDYCQNVAHNVRIMPCPYQNVARRAKFDAQAIQVRFSGHYQPIADPSAQRPILLARKFIRMGGEPTFAAIGSNGNNAQKPGFAKSCRLPESRPWCRMWRLAGLSSTGWMLCRGREATSPKRLKT